MILINITFLQLWLKRTVNIILCVESSADARVICHFYQKPKGLRTVCNSAFQADMIPKITFLDAADAASSHNQFSICFTFFTKNSQMHF